MDGILKHRGGISASHPALRALLLGAAALLGAASLHADDASKGAAVFSSECSGCHSVMQGKNKMGPSLFGVVGRPAGSIAGFSYSDGMKASAIVWQEDTLQRYLENPAETVHGCRMPYPGLKDVALRYAVIAYLETLH